MRLMLDTCVLIDYIADTGKLSRQVESLIDDYDNQLFASIETARELVIQFNNGGLVSRHWQTAEQMLRAISDEFFVQFLPLNWEHLLTYSNLQVNTVQDHRDPSDHIIISHAITNKMTLLSSDNKFPFYQKQGLDLIMNIR